MSLVNLGLDPDKRASSMPVIERGPDRGYRRRESTGRWTYITGYDHHVRSSEKSAHNAWANRLLMLGFCVGVAVNDGVTSFYVFERNPQ